MDIIETAKKEDLSKRIMSFQTDLKELTVKYSLQIRPQISPDGPIISIIDVKNENKAPESQPVNPVEGGAEN